MSFGGWSRDAQAWALALGTLVALGGTGVLLIIGLQDRPLPQVIMGPGAPWWQAIIGAAGGWAIAELAWRIIASGWMRPVLDRYAALVGPLLPGTALQLVVFVCAGVGEELLFRGALQHWFGIPATAVLFVALHGYLDPRDRRILAYGAFMTAAMLLFGWQASRHGLIAPIIAHTVIDAVLLRRLVAHWRRTSP